MEKKFNSNHLKNIQVIFEEKTGTNITKNKSYVNRKYVMVFAAILLCFATFSAFAYAKFSSLNGDQVAFYPSYKGDGIVEITIDNYSDIDLKLQEQIQLKQWSTAEEVEGDKEKITFNNMEVKADSRETIVIDLSEGYDIEKLEKALPEADYYYIVLTNNNFAFGQDWMCGISFDESISCEVPERDNNYRAREETEVSTDEIPLVYEDWCWPTASKNISTLYGEGTNGIFNDHVNISGKQGDKVYAVAAGKVIETGYVRTFGNYIVLELDDGKIVKYGHLKKVLVKEDDLVDAGEKIGTLGQTGMATGPNLYFAVYVNDVAVNPLVE